MKNCRFCNFLDSRKSKGFIDLFDNLSCDFELLADLNDFFIILDVAPISAGHVLVVSKKHKQSFLSYWVNQHNKLQKILKVISAVIFEKKGVNSIACEHGLLQRYKGSSGCIDHAHIHVIPINIKLIDSLRDEVCELHETYNFGRKLNSLSANHYIYFKDIDCKEYISISNEIPSQLIRRIIAKKTGKLYWSWKDYIDFSEQTNTKETIVEGKKIFESLASKFSEFNIN